MRPSGAAAARPEEGAAAEAVAAAVPRLVSAGLEASLERFNDRTLLAAGKVNLISVEAVQTRLGARWALRQDQVYGFSERVLERGVGPRGLFLRVSTTDFLIVQPDYGRLAGQAACLRYLREIFNHFLGDAHMAGEGVLQVTRIAKGSVEAKLIDVGAAEQADGEEPEEAPPADGEALASLSMPLLPAATPPARKIVDQWSPFISSDGRNLRVSTNLEPVYELKGFTRIGFRMIRRVIVIRNNEVLNAAQMANLSAADLLKVDLATVARGIDRLQAEAAEEEHLSLIIPLSYASLSSSRGRAHLVQPLREAGKLVKCGVICEICDIEGVPTGSLLAAVSMIKPFILLVEGRLTTAAPPLVRRLKGTGLRALSIECPPSLADDEFSDWAERTIRKAKRVAKSVMVYCVRSERRAGELAMLGATHVSLQYGS
ncbi:MAG: hypothetical protein E7812_11800 [Phenylobacterium sp.]|nr:MAG: hypothetical protein E7812_11800 [Phenylobacterium sp.]